MGRIEVLVVFAVTAFDLSVMPGRIRFNQLVPDTELRQRYLKERRLGAVFGIQPVRELRTIICLDAFNRIGELFYAMLDKFG